MEHDSDEELNSQNSIVHIQANEGYPKKDPVVEDPSLNVPFQLLNGEYATYLGRTTEGTIILSNYRLCINNQDTFFVVPLRLIEQVECREIFFLYIYCKDARSIRCTFATNEHAVEWYRRLLAATAPPQKLEDLFSFAFHAWCTEESQQDLHQALSTDDVPLYNLANEAVRMKFNLDSVWRISNLNQNHKYCPTYPKQLLVPASIEDEELKKVAEYRTSRRFPIVVWRHQNNGSVIARCSQPEVGWLGWRSNYDENLIQAIAKACASDSGLKDTAKVNSEKQNPNCFVANQEFNEPVATLPRILILDARSYAAAVANRAKGGGCECPEYYPNCEIQFMSLANIHSIRKSFNSVRVLCSSSGDHANWFSMIENTKWLQNMSGLMKAAMTVVNAIDRDGQPVLVHCSDGWDRTPQIVALAELILDPYYRTIEGFQVLVEREWLEFGHKFGDRCGHGLQAEDTNERCPVFLQWLDCVHQLLHQFPCSFEFNETFLMKLVHHTYSCLFGTFLCNSAKERTKGCVAERTYSVWAFLKINQHRFRNFLFNSKDQVLRPSCHVRDLLFWTAVYMPSSATTEEIIQPEANPHLASGMLEAGEGNLNKTRSCDDLLSMAEPNQGRQRRSSDPSIDGKHPFSQEYQNGICDYEPSSLINNDTVPESCNVKFSNGELETVQDKEQESSLPADWNGTTVATGVDNGADSDGSLGHQSPSELQQQTDNVAFESSTDTLVGELGVLPVESHSDVKNNSGNKGACMSLKKSDNCTHRTTVTENGRFQDELNRWLSVSTSTSDISDSHVISREEVKQLVVAYTANPSKGIYCDRCFIRINEKKVPEPGQLDGFKSTSSGQNSINSTPLHSRTPSSGFPATPNDDRLLECNMPRSFNVLAHKLDVDGLTVLKDDVQHRLHEIKAAQLRESGLLKQELYAARLLLYQQICPKCNGTTILNQEHADEVVSLPDSVGSGEQQSLGHESNSDFSWEQVEENDTKPTLWVPDHAVSRCTGCETEFWLGRRKHHCRNCGKIFCANCSSQMVPIPNEQLYQPVRVCSYCFENLCSSRCKQQAFGGDKLSKAIISPVATTAAASN